MTEEDTEAMVWIFCKACGVVDMQEVNLGHCHCCGEQEYEEHTSYEAAAGAAELFLL